MKKTIIYIAHCISAPTKEGIEENLADLRRIIRHINLKFPTIVPFCPYYADIVSLDDNVPAERKRGIENDTAIFHSGMVHRVWLTGPYLSGGMQAEKNLAQQLGIPVENWIGRF